MNNCKTEKIVHAIIAYRFWIIVVVTILTGVAIFGMTKIYIDNDSMKAVPADLKEKLAFNDFQKTFPTPFRLLFMAKFSNGTVYDKVDSMSSWSDLFSKIMIDTVSALENIIHLGAVKIPVKGGFFGIKSEPLIPVDRNLSEEMLNDRLSKNKELTKGLISSDQNVLGMVLEISHGVYRPDVVEKVTAIYEELNKRDGVKLYLTGSTATPYLLNKFMKRDFSILLPLCILISSILLYLIFHRILYVISALSIIAIAIVWTFGVVGFTGIPFSVVTSVIPVILFPIGVADSIHVLKTYFRMRWKDKKDFHTSFVLTYKELIRPIVLTSITTFFGFGSFAFSQISWTRHFGLFTGLGVMISLFLTVLLIPIFLYYEDTNDKPVVKKDKSINSLSHSFMNIYNRLIFKTQLWKVLLGLTLIICGYGVFQVTYESNPISFFSDDSFIKKSDKLIGKYFGGTRFFYITLRHRKSQLFKEAHWNEINTIINEIKSEEIVGDVSSLVPLINLTSEILSNKQISAPAISLLLKSKGLFGKNFGSFVNSMVTKDRRCVKLQITCHNIPGYKYTDMANRLEQKISADHSEWEVIAAGPTLLVDAMLSLIIQTQISSLLIAFGSVFIVLIILFRSFKIGFFATFPIVLSTVCVYALMGILKVPINTVTVIVVNTCIGIGIDYSIHFTSGYIYCKDNFKNNIDALLYTVKNKGSVIMFNTFVVGIGFLVLVFSSFPPIRQFGLFIFISMMTSSFFSLIFLPVFFKNFKFNRAAVSIPVTKER